MGQSGAYLNAFVLRKPRGRCLNLGGGRGGFVPRRSPSKLAYLKQSGPGCAAAERRADSGSLAATVEWAPRVDVPANRILSIDATEALSLKTMV
jgi:hypothetical protein